MVRVARLSENVLGALWTLGGSLTTALKGVLFLLLVRLMFRDERALVGGHTADQRQSGETHLVCLPLNPSHVILVLPHRK